jgi:tetratricopeptide (TPR) repeat protein
VPLAAQQTGRITGKVLDVAGNPIPGAVMVLKRFDITYSKEIKVDGKGVYLQSGLEVKEYEMTLTAEGFVGIKDKIKVPLGETLVRNFTLLTPDQHIAQTGMETASSLKASAGNSIYTEAVGLYNSKNFVEAMQKFEAAIENYSESISKSTEETSIGDAKQFHAKAIELLAESQFEAGNADLELRGTLWSKAEPTLQSTFDTMPADDKSPERARLAYQLGQIAKLKGDAALEKKYGDILEMIEGPKVENSYNTAVALYNAGKLSEAKPHLKKAIDINPSFAETYYLLAFCELNGGDMQAAKTCFQKYPQLAPTGKYAAEVKEMLAEF